MIKTIASPIERFMLYIPANNMNAINIIFPKNVSNKLTNKPGIANIITHNVIKSVSNPTTKFRLLREKTEPNDSFIIYYQNIISSYLFIFITYKFYILLANDLKRTRIITVVHE